MTDTTIARPRVTLDDTTALWLRAYTETKAEIARLEEVAKQARMHLETALGDAEESVVDGHVVVRWAHVTSSRVDVTKLAAEEPEVAERFRVATVTRRLTIPEATS